MYFDKSLCTILINNKKNFLMMIMTTMNLTWKIYEFFLDNFFCFCVLDLNFPRNFLSCKIKTKTDKREEFLSNSNYEFEVAQVQ